MRVGIDLGGTKIEIIAIDKTGKQHFRHRVATPTHDYEEIIRTIVELIRTCEQAIHQPISKIGIGTPGIISPVTDVIKNSNTACLIGKPLHLDLEKSLNRSVKVANDANCFTLSEAIDGAGAQAHVVFGVILGTGVGGGIAVNQQIIIGPNAIAGEWGHNPLPWPQNKEWPGTPCYCGKTGCIETFLSGAGLAKDYFKNSGKQLSAKAIANLLKKEDVHATTVISHYEERLAKALAHVINILDPNVIVLGGGLSNIERFYMNVPKLWSRYIFSDHVSTKLAKNIHGDSSGVRGAAWLWPDS